MSNGRAWATTGFVLGVAASVAGNVAHVWHPTPEYLAAHHTTAGQFRPELGAQIAGAFWPIALLITVEVLARVDWPRTFWWIVARFGGAALVAGVAAVMSYAHLNGLLRAYGETDASARLGPLSVDGLMVICGGALLALGHHGRDHSAEGGTGEDLDALSERVAVMLRDHPEPQVTAEIDDPWDHVEPTPGTTPAEVFGTTPGEVEREAIEGPIRATPSATPRSTVSATVGTTAGTTSKGGTKRAPKGGTKRRTRAETKVALQKLIANLDADQIQVKPLAEELGASRRTVRDLLDEMNVRPIPAAGARQ